MRPDQEKPIVYSSAARLNGDRPMTTDNHPAADHNLPLEPTTIKLLAEIRSELNPQNGKIGTPAKPAKRKLGSNW